MCLALTSAFIIIICFIFHILYSIINSVTAGTMSFIHNYLMRVHHNAALQEILGDLTNTEHDLALTPKM